MPPLPLTDSEIDKALATLPGWHVENGELATSFTLDRARVRPFYAAVAAAEDDANHHARVTVLYGTVSFALNTHDAGGAITAKDIALADHLSRIATAHGATLET